MAQQIIGFTWKIDTPLGVGTGMSKAGYADRLVRRVEGKPYLPGDAVKGAIRGTAERIARWLVAFKFKEEDKESSRPIHPALIRIFDNREAPYYRFQPSIGVRAEEPKRFCQSSTRIDSITGVAASQSLRTIEQWQRGIQFPAVVTVSGLDWTNEEHRDDVLLVCAAIQGTDSIGGKRSAGAGYITCQLTLPAELGDGVTLGSAATIERLRKHLEKGAAACPITE